ncbi:MULTISPECIES: SP_0009 family protein [Streptococcus]|uniref:Extracellular protein n=1 Tax=Streptococcus porcorum TaxID=701526 RepID=A0ABV2JFG5_9STRE|nr:recombinase [Streptococcus sp.]MDY3824651.1 SP_0009 family protein [Streptococcus sp.]
MENLLEKVTLFLSYSDDKLEELKQKNQALHLEESDIERQQ